MGIDQVAAGVLTELQKVALQQAARAAEWMTPTDLVAHVNHSIALAHRCALCHEDGADTLFVVPGTNLHHNGDGEPVWSHQRPAHQACLDDQSQQDTIYGSLKGM